MARSSHLSRREGGRYYLQIRLKSFTHGSPSRLVRFSLGTSDYGHARHELADRMGWLLPMQTSKSSVQRYHVIRAQLEAFNDQGPVTHRTKLAARCNFEHVVRGLIDDMGGLKEDGPFNAAWMSFCQENLAAEERIATADRLAVPLASSIAISSRSPKDRYLPVGTGAEGARWVGGIPPELRNQRGPSGVEMPASTAACSLVRPRAIACQKRQ